MTDFDHSRDVEEEWHPFLPAEIIECPVCQGEGIEVYRTFIYEHGCGFGHDSSDERPCPECGGAGYITTNWELISEQHEEKL